MDNFSYKESTTSLVFYGLFILISVYFGVFAITKANDNDFYINFMLKWKHTMLDYQHSGVPLPHLDKENPVEYMRKLSQNISNYALSAGSPDFTHNIKLKNGQVSKVFLLAQYDTLHLYGLDKKTVDNLDKMIDGKNNHASGSWLAFPYEDQLRYHAVWFYKKS